MDEQDKIAKCQVCGHERQYHELSRCVDGCYCDVGTFRYFNREQIDEIARALARNLSER